MPEPTAATVRMAMPAPCATCGWRRPRRWGVACAVAAAVAVAASSVCMGAASRWKTAAGTASASRDSAERAAASVRRVGH